MSGVAQFSASVTMIDPAERVRIADAVWLRGGRTLDPAAGIKGIQRGIISVPAGVITNNVAIGAVVMSKSFVTVYANCGSGMPESHRAHISTSVLLVVVTAVSIGDAGTVVWEVVEYV